MRLLAICGSLRAASINRGLLRAVQLCAPDGVECEIYPELGDLPLFNPDHEGHEPLVVKRLFAAVEAADGLVIASPEYAHGVTGSIKNLLDWLVVPDSRSPFVGAFGLYRLGERVSLFGVVQVYAHDDAISRNPIVSKDRFAFVLAGLVYKL